ncbi:MAG: small multi-drug export protein [bacterium]|nr:small multi-drug export protein [bacterium]
MLHYLLSLLKGIQPEPLTLIVAMIPIAELRGAIPLALSMNVPVIKAFFLAVVGNLIPILPILFFLDPVSNYLRKFPAFDRFFTWLFQRTRNRSNLIERLELVGLALFVAVPLPMTGAWTGAIAAHLFRFRIRDAFIAIAVGVLLAGVVVTLTCLGVIRLCPLFVAR